DKVTAAREALDDLPPLSEGPLGGTCPHCGEKVHNIQDRKPGVTKYTLEKPGKTPSEKEVKERREQRREAESMLAGAEKSLRQAEDIQRGYENAVSKLAEIEGQETTDPAVIEDARQRVRSAEARINAKLAKERADKLHNSIRNNQTLIDILKPDGLRKRRMAFAATEFNKERLTPLCDAAGWDAVELDHDLNLRYGGRVAIEPMRSEAQVYRAHATLQLALAQIDGSSMVVLDRADCLDAAGRNGLFSMLKAAGVPALVGMMMNKPGAVPDLAAANMGRSYWIESGEAVELGAKEAA
ncbi:MAG: hypothetical protein HQL36_03075, partial [Alphaproteobacteria bacterium]|nr:hypothetical protein [Alphaproteobacteria bacterium]